VGSVTSAAYGHTLGRAVAMGYVEMPGAADARVIADATFELEIADRRVTARGSLRAPYDPAGARVKS
jgi:4-methylaminobutanoate oxidase (formaldehyde-forming)